MREHGYSESGIKAGLSYLIQPDHGGFTLANSTAHE